MKLISSVKLSVFLLLFLFITTTVALPGCSSGKDTNVSEKSADNGVVLDNDKDNSQGDTQGNSEANSEGDTKDNTQGNSQGNTPGSNQGTTEGKASGQSPHQYGSFQSVGAEFTGGSTVTDYNLSGIRRVSHPEFIRLVFEFSRGDTGEAGEAPPTYKVKLLKDPLRISMELKGVTKASVLENKKQVLELTDVVKDINFVAAEGNNAARVDMELSGEALFQVFEVGDPARVVVVLNPQGPKSGQV